MLTAINNACYQFCGLWTLVIDFWSPHGIIFTNTDLYSIPACTSNCKHCNVWGEIIYPFPNSNGADVEVGRVGLAQRQRRPTSGRHMGSHLLTRIYIQSRHAQVIANIVMCGVKLFIHSQIPMVQTLKSAASAWHSDSADRISGQFIFYRDYNFTKSKENLRFRRLVPLFVPIGVCVTTHDDGTASDVTIGMWRHN